MVGVPPRYFCRMPAIPVHELPRQLPVPFALMRIAAAGVPPPETVAVHRHPHYSFLLYESGTATAMVDLQTVTFGAGSIYYFLPGQVHQRLREHEVQGWFLEVDVALIPSEFHQVFESGLALQPPLALPVAQRHHCRSLLAMLHERAAPDGTFPLEHLVTRALLQAVVGLFAGAYAQPPPTGAAVARSRQLTYQFRRLLGQHFQTLKSPSAYARQLCVSANHLNALLKKETGFSVSYWITHALMLEAKRLLVYSTLDVKAIAATLGYTDYPYFSRFFKKQAGVSPGAFRQQKQ